MKKLLLLFLTLFTNLSLQNLHAQAALVKDINPGSAASNPGSFTQLGNNILFTASDPTNGRELWITDGTEAGTTLLKDLNPGTGNGVYSPLYLVGDEIYFYGISTEAPSGGIFKTDGTTVGTVLVKSGFSSNGVGDFTEVNGTVFFVADSNSNNLDELWKTDGTPAGTVLVKSFRPNSFFYSYTRYLTPSPVANELLFTADNGTGMALWKSDGTTAGTFTLKYLYNTPQNLVRRLVELNGEVFFGAYVSGSVESLWKTDGTATGTVIFKTPYRLPSSSGIKNIDGQLYFGGYEQYSDGYGEELWTSSGTLPSTYMIRDINDGSGNSSPYNFLKFQGNIYFSAETVNEGREFWKTDGTFAGTHLVFDFFPGSSSGYPQTYTNEDLSRIYIIADNGTDVMLYESNGTQAGTNSIIDISESNSITSTEVISVNGVLFFNRQTVDNGTELWKLDTTLSVSDLQTENIVLHPNPVTDYLVVTSKISEDFQVKIYDMLGKLMLSEINNIKNEPIKVSHLKAGLYILKVTTSEGTSQTIKFIKN